MALVTLLAGAQREFCNGGGAVWGRSRKKHGSLGGAQSARKFCIFLAKITLF